MTPDRMEEFVERAAIIEFGSEEYMTRQDAERLAAAQLGMSEDEIEFLQGARNARA